MEKFYKNNMSSKFISKGKITKKYALKLEGVRNLDEIKSYIKDHEIVESNLEEINNIIDDVQKQSAYCLKVLQEEHDKISDENEKITDMIESLPDSDFINEELKQIKFFMVDKNRFLIATSLRTLLEKNYVSLKEGIDGLYHKIIFILNNNESKRKSVSRFKFNAYCLDRDDEDVIMERIQLLRSAKEQYDIKSRDQINMLHSEIRQIRNTIDILNKIEDSDTMIKM